MMVECVADRGQSGCENHWSRTLEDLSAECTISPVLPAALECFIILYCRPTIHLLLLICVCMCVHVLLPQGGYLCS